MSQQLDSVVGFAQSRADTVLSAYRTTNGGTPTQTTNSGTRTSPKTEERLAVLRAAREKRKEGSLGTTGMIPLTTTVNATTTVPTRGVDTATRALGSQGACATTSVRTPVTSSVSTSTVTSPPSGGVPLGVGASVPRSPAVPGTSGGTPSSVLTPSGRGTGVETQQPLGPAIRRPSIVVIEKEKKTDYWKDVELTVTEQGAKISGEDFNSVISRAMSLGIVGHKKQRESFSGSKSQELLEQLKSSMEKRIVELNGGKQLNLNELNNSTNILEKVLNLERALMALETRKSQEEEEEKKLVQNKIVELERSLRALEVQKVQQREQNRRTMKLEIANLKQMMEKVQKDKENEVQVAQEAKVMATKMNKLEAALRLMNEDRKKRSVEDKDTLLLKRKLVLFEQKLQEMEAEKKIREDQDEDQALKDKLMLMEDKLVKMERRKSTSLTLQMQQKMELVEKQLALLRNERNVDHSDAINQKIVQKMATLEKQLQIMAQQKITPSMIQDEETVSLREHIKKLEENVLLQEHRMEEQRRAIEEERKRNYERRLQDEESFRQQARQKEEELLKRIMLIEGKIKQGVVDGGGGAADQELVARLKKLEEMGASGVGISPDLSEKFSKLEKKLEETQKQLEDERKITAEFFAMVPKEGTELADWQKDAQIARLKKDNDDLLERILLTITLIDKKLIPTPSNKSGLTYAEINAKLAEIQAKLFDEKTDERESEQLNIEYEKLITELEQTKEYQKEQEEMRDKWRKENEIPNKEAFEKVFAYLKAIPEQKLTAVLKRKPELKFILRTPDQLLKAHANDFKQVSTQNLLLIEARALYHNMPVFRKDQEQQLQFVQQLQAKIESETSKTAKPSNPPPPIEPKKKVVIKTKKRGGGGGNAFLDELLAKRKRKE